LDHGEALKARFNVEVSRAFSPESFRGCPRLVMDAARRWRYAGLVALSKGEFSNSRMLAESVATIED